ncbi:adenylyl cyclase-associated protein 1 [Bombina bombina]|uniref:adenylyl cyclase-associated protein 1 n=1 Tax=Bombina bombina TaxID=8345 RepID=UPI00235AF4BE|nr:adenylyl cyclase-associated protein 1 [Bombina bombina]XP_053563276.1 adenylyl cyclase-associated protein 1 [Bombina bombina]XP_053563277.1 adenylyl cyclase-associated protein 1 [Bombina bombina]
MADMHTLVDRLEKAVGKLEILSQSSGFGGGSGGDSGSGDAAVFVQVYDSLLNGPVADFVKHSKDIGGEVDKQAQMLLSGFKLQRDILVKASQYQQPDEKDRSALLAPLSGQIQAAQDYREKNRGAKHFNHLSAVSESIPALGWVAVAPKPGPFVKEMMDAAMFYTNRVLKEYKDVDKKHVDWVRSYLNIWTELQAYIKEHHTTGLSWKKSGPKAASAPCAPPPPRAGPPPPPPGGPPPPPPSSSAPSDDTLSRSQLFAQLNQGEKITKALKHVPDDMKTHKNPTLKSQAGPIRSGPKPFTSPKPTNVGSPAPKPVAKKQPPVLELEGKKWRVENQDNVSNLEISDTELKQVVYIYKCVNSTLQIKGKINSIIVDNCKKLGLVFEDAVGIVEIINSQSVKVQVLGKVPTISINKTDGCHVYLSQDSLECEIISAKSSEMNILVPGSGGDYSEFPVPEQFKTVWNGEKLVTTVTEIAG